MPDRTYIERKSTLVERLLHHPFQIILSVVLLIVGGVTLTVTRTLPSTVELLPLVLSYGFSVLAFVAGITSLVGGLGRWPWTLGWEAAGQVLSSATWLFFALTLLDRASSVRWLLIILAFLGLSFAHIVRLIALTLTVKRAREGVSLASRVIREAEDE